MGDTETQRRNSNQARVAQTQPGGQSLPAGAIIITPSADGTVQELAARGSDPSSPVVTVASGPSAMVTNTRIPVTPIDRVDQHFVFNFLRYGLATGGAQDFSGLTKLNSFSNSLPVPPSGNRSLIQASFAEAGVVEFDLGGIKSALQQLNVQNTAVRATLRLTPIRSLNMFDFLTPSPAFQPPSATRVALLNMTPDQEDLVVNYKDFPRFVSPRFTDPDDVATAIRVSAPDRVTTLRTDLLGLLTPITFDVTPIVQRDLRASSPTTGFLVASELNGTGLLFADSSTQIPGISEVIAPQLVIQIDGFTPPGKAQFVCSTTRLPFDILPQGSTDMMLVTVNNIGGSSGTVKTDLTAGSNAFGLVTPDGHPLSAQGNTATIAAGKALTFGVIFKPVDGDKFDGQVQVTDTTGGNQNVSTRIALSGGTLPAKFSERLPAITAPIKPQRLPDHAARVGDLNGDGLIDAADISRLAAIVASSVAAPSLGTAAFAVADINGDGVIDQVDLTILGDALARNRDALPRLRPAASEIRQASRTQRQSSAGSVQAGNSTGRARTGVAIMPRGGR